MSFAVGSLVKARDREWVVLPESKDDLLLLRPLGGGDAEICGICTTLEQVTPAKFGLPSPEILGDFQSCSLLRDSLRLGFRSSAGPFRSFANIAVEPRPYQLVPLLMALKVDPVRILIADDVGIGKTIEACLIVKELLERGEINRFAVLCPPQLAEQWQLELYNKFHIDAELVLSSTATRLEKKCIPGQSLFDVYPHTIVSTDFIKADRRRDDFLRACPEMVIIDEAHSCTFGAAGRGSRHQRYELIRGLSQKETRHMLFVTATPHSGNENAFRCLLSFLNPDFKNLPEDLAGKENVDLRRYLAQYFVQRRRADIRYFLQTDTEFPTRQEAEEHYKLSDDYKTLFNKVLQYARETVIDKTGKAHKKRVKWWSALALLRSLASSPAAAVATLKNRAAVADTETEEEADQIGRQTVFDLEDDEQAERIDIAPGCDIEDIEQVESSVRKRLLSFAREAEKLYHEKDNKLKEATKYIKDFLKNGFRPIVFCRFIPTAEYVASYLADELRGTEVLCITGNLPPSERENRIKQPSNNPKRVLVCTDCLSEGINLQDHFDAVMHYDLTWNPTRHEQREGRVDRYGQKKKEIRVLTFYGIDNQIDGIVLDVLLRKHKKIRSSLGISVPVPVDTNSVVEAIFEGLLLRESSGTIDQYLPGFEEYMKPRKEDLYTKWDNATEKEKRSRTLFAQETIKTEVVQKELQEVQSSVGTGIEVQKFVRNALYFYGGVVSDLSDGTIQIDLSRCPTTLKDYLQTEDKFGAKFELPIEKDTILLTRTHPFVESLANYIMNGALDELEESIAKRAGVIKTAALKQMTTLLLVRFRYDILTKKEKVETPLLAEDCKVLGFEGFPSEAVWLNEERTESILKLRPDANIDKSLASDLVQDIINEYDQIQPHLEQVAKENGQKLLESHQRVRAAAQAKGIRFEVEPKLPVDVLGIYVYLPKV
jgi:superfamily II DNA or RNA helicase